MVIIGVDPHPDSHTLVALDHNGAVLDSLIVGNSFEELHELKSWAASYPQRCWAIEGAGNRFIAPWVACLLAQKERVVNISPNLTSQYRCRRGKKKNDLIDAENAAKVLLANPDLPLYQPLQAQRELKELTRTRMRLSRQLTANRMALKDLEPATPAGQALSRLLEVLQRELASLDRALKQIAKQLLPELCRLQGVGPCVAGVILAEVSDVRRFANEDHFAAYSGAAPVPKSSGKLKRVQVNPAGNRRLNWAFHMIALTRLRIDARSKALFKRKQQEGKTPKEALRVLKTYIAREIYRFLKANPLTPPLSA